MTTGVFPLQNRRFEVKIWDLDAGDPGLPVADMPGLDQGATLIFQAPGKPAPWTQTWTVGDVLETESLDYTYGLFTGKTAACTPPPVCTVDSGVSR
ncbi:hypothetical protein ACI77F_10745 [Pseudomonas tritici]|uniref:hypothetical protein n=1 Tax=Pseudomonas tritici TaxID=2745518 RepID=UPI00387B1F4C